MSFVVAEKDSDRRFWQACLSVRLSVGDEGSSTVTWMEALDRIRPGSDAAVWESGVMMHLSSASLWSGGAERSREGSKARGDITCGARRIFSTSRLSCTKVRCVLGLLSLAPRSKIPRPGILSGGGLTCATQRLACRTWRPRLRASHRSVLGEEGETESEKAKRIFGFP